jgi:hypothetical protein
MQDDLATLDRLDILPSSGKEKERKGKKIISIVVIYSKSVVRYPVIEGVTVTEQIDGLSNHDPRPFKNSHCCESLHLFNDN